jgi:tetratricopeptide (TPR) repeat protein
VLPRLAELKDKLGEANTLKALGDLAMRTSALREARERYDRALKIFREIEDKLGEANALKALGDLAMRTAALGEAREQYDRALARIFHREFGLCA